MEFAVETAWQAGKITLRYFQTGVEPEWKEDESPVTVADRQTEEKIRSLIEKAFPEDGIIGRSSGKNRADRETVG